MDIHIPESHRNLLQARAFAHLATINPDGSPQLTPVWIDHHEHDGRDCLLVNSAQGRIKNRNVRLNPKIAIEIQDRDNPYRYMTVRGTVADITADNGVHIEALSDRYLGRPYPWWGPDEGREVFHIKPEQVTAVDIEAHHPGEEGSHR